MSMSTQVNPFSHYIHTFFAPLLSEITAWLAHFEKTMDDVVWWELNVSRPSPFSLAPTLDQIKQSLTSKVRITVAFSDSEVKHEYIFTHYGPISSQIVEVSA